MTAKFNHIKIPLGGNMRKVKFLEDYENYKKGDVVRIDRQLATELNLKNIVTYYFMREV